MTPYHFSGKDSLTIVYIDERRINMQHARVREKVVRGFTLVETMVAITILALALVGPFSAVQNALISSYVARDQLVATALAQEALEYVRGIRDNNYLNTRTWLHGFNVSAENRNRCYGTGSAPSGWCTVDATQGDFHNTSTAMQGYTGAASAVPALYINPNGFFYQPTTATSDTVTKFRRAVQIREISATEAEVTVTVTWITARQTYSMTITDVLRDWL